MNINDETRVCVAKIGAAHGIQGEVRVKPFIENPNCLADLGILEDQSGKRQFEILSSRPQKTVLVIRFKGFLTRNDVEPLNGVELFVSRDVFPEIDTKDEFYQADLVGLVVESTTGELLGKVSGIYNFGAGDLVEIAPEHAPRFYVPFTKESIPVIDMDAGKLVAYLLPDAQDVDGEEEPD
ncbi:MAG: ribosome maturation factor RimM [Cohaesibacteraceae bacterium]|nr:ribosome maturation factor RimM [Cohaesibacteraceae bacterium]